MEAGKARAARKCSKHAAAMAGAVSRPSVNRCKMTSSPAAFKALAKSRPMPLVRMHPAWGQRPIRWMRPVPAFARCTVLKTRADPPVYLVPLSMRGRVCSTTRPAPMFRCPTSELPICPSGRPTSAPLAASSARAVWPKGDQKQGYGPGQGHCVPPLSRWPQPSRMMRAVGRFFVMAVIIEIKSADLPGIVAIVAHGAGHRACDQRDIAQQVCDDVLILPPQNHQNHRCAALIIQEKIAALGGVPARVSRAWTPACNCLVVCGPLRRAKARACPAAPHPPPKRSRWIAPGR